MNPPIPRPYTVGEAAVLLQLTEETIRDHIRAGQISAVKIGRTYRISAGEMARLTGEAVEVAS